MTAPDQLLLIVGLSSQQTFKRLSFLQKQQLDVSTNQLEGSRCQQASNDTLQPHVGSTAPRWGFQ